MKLYEIYEGIRAVSIMDIAERIVGLKTKLKFRETISDAEWQWLRLTCENQSILSKLSKASNRYISPTTNYADIPFEFLRSGGTCAEAKLFLNQIKTDMDYEAETKILQAQIAQQQAYVDLQNSYTQATNDNAELVTKLANSATDI